MTKYILLVLALFFALPLGISFIVDAGRVTPDRPEETEWWPEVLPQYATIGGIETRFISAGAGPDLLLLHTFSTELGQFRKVAKTLAQDYRVWAVDLPGFGYSDLPTNALSAQTYIDFTTAFLETMDLQDLTIVGESIGGTIPIAMVAQGNERIARIVSSDPIGIQLSPLSRSSRIARVFTFFMRTPVLSGFIQRIRNARSSRGVLAGAMYDIKNMPEQYFADLMTINQRPEFPLAQKSFLDHADSWNLLVEGFDKVTVPVHVLWGDAGWATPAEQKEFVASIPGATSKVITQAGHFISLDQPDAILEAVASISSED